LDTGGAGKPLVRWYANDITKMESYEAEMVLRISEK